MEISEKTANDLCDAIERFRLNIENFTTTTLEESIKMIVINTYMKLEKKENELNIKYKTSSIFTKWYWKIKHRKALEKFSKFKTEPMVIEIIKSQIS